MNQASLQYEPYCVSFSGIDGAGKSTQIALLLDELRSAGLRTELITFWDDVVVLKRFREGAGHKVFKGDTGVGSPETPIQRRDKNVQSPLLTLVRMAFYLLDVLSLRRIVRQARNADPELEPSVLVFDRFIYDELANINSKSRWTQRYISIILRLAPRPDVAFLLDADPEKAFARKPEYPLEFLHLNRSSYLRLAETAGLVVIAPASVEVAHAQVVGRMHQSENALLANV